MQVGFSCRGQYTLSLIIVPNITPPISDQNLFTHRHQLLVRELPGINPSLSLYFSKGFLIATNIRELLAEIHAEREDKSHIRHQQDNKGPQ